MGNKCLNARVLPLILSILFGLRFYANMHTFQHTFRVIASNGGESLFVALQSFIGKIFHIFTIFSQTLPTVAIKEVCTCWFYNQGTVSFGFSIFYFNTMRNCVKITIFGSQAFFLSSLYFTLNHIVKGNPSYF